MDWLNEMYQQQQMAQEQQAYINQQLISYGERATKTKKKDVLAYLQYLSNATCIEQVDEFETPNARHICQGTKDIKILPKGVVNVPTTEGNLPVEYFLCQSCRLLLVNKSCFWML